MHADAGKEPVVLAAGLTPALQQALVFDRLKLGEVNRAREAHLFGSGKVLNVGQALHHLGGSSVTLALIGGVTGEGIDREFSAAGIEHRWIWSGKPTRLCTTIIDRSSGTTTELVENASEPAAEDLEEFIRAYDEAVSRARIVVLTGSLPAGTPASFYRDLIERTPIPVVLDASGPELIAALPARPFCIKPNRVELARSLGIAIDSDADLRRAIAQTHSLGAERVLVSHGAEALWAGFAGTMHIFHPPKILAVNPIASGDCLAAGLAWALARGTEFHEALRFGMAAAAENAAMMLSGRLDPAHVRRRMAEVADETAPGESG